MWDFIAFAKYKALKAHSSESLYDPQLSLPLIQLRNYIFYNLLYIPRTYRFYNSLYTPRSYNYEHMFISIIPCTHSLCWRSCLLLQHYTHKRTQLQLRRHFIISIKSQFHRLNNINIITSIANLHKLPTTEDWIRLIQTLVIQMSWHCISLVANFMYLWLRYTINSN